jgi:hypothetical protein
MVSNMSHGRLNAAFLLLLLTGLCGSDAFRVQQKTRKASKEEVAQQFVPSIPERVKARARQVMRKAEGPSATTLPDISESVDVEKSAWKISEQDLHDVTEKAGDSLNSWVPTRFDHPSFEIVRQDQVAELNKVNFTLYKHLKTGAQVMSVEADDDNKVFGVAFRTPVSDSTGVPHILEHSVLCGSRKYPVKDPFIQMNRNSLKTFLNAMTYPDRTVYPVSSQNSKDFNNLASVYLDAVLHPKAVDDPLVLAQEGWHYELDKEDDPLTFKGVVYNEMKGAMASPESKMMQAALSGLFPDTTYRHNSGGEPKDIPTLTFEKFRGFYKQNYHPSNGRFFFYGDNPVGERLDLLDSYLEEFGEPPEPVEVSRVDTQKMWNEPQHVKTSFPVTAEEADSEGGAKHMFQSYWLLNEEPLPYSEQLAMSVVNDLLMGSPSAPLYKALIRSGLGDSVMRGGYDDTLKQSTFSVGLKGIKKEDVPKVEALITDTLQGVVDEGFTQEEVAAAMNNMEFGLREFSSSSTNLGMSIFLEAAGDWIYERDPIQGLRFEKPLEEIKAALEKDGGSYLEALVEKHLIKNTHRLSLEGVPDATMAAREEEEEKKSLADKQASMSADEIADVVKGTAVLKAEQASVDTKEQLDTLPKLTVKDLTKKDEDYDITVGEKQGVPVLTHDVPSSGILYTELVLDLAVLPIDYLKFLPIFVELQFGVGTSELSDKEFTDVIGSETGGLSAEKFNQLKIGEGGTVADPNDVAFRLMVKGKATADKAPELFGLLTMGIADSKLDSQDRVLERLKSSKARMETALKTAGNTFAQMRISARRSLTGYIEEVTGGVTYYESLPGLIEMAEKDWPQFLHKLQTINTLILQKEAMLINLSGDKETLEKADAPSEVFVTSLLAAAKERELPDVEGPTVADAMKGKPELRLEAKNEGFEVLTPVNYVAKGGALFNEGEKISGTTDVVVRLISQSYMWDNVRVLGGAYGGGCALSPVSGTYFCGSYRDPNLKATLDTFDSVASYLEELEIDDKDIEQLVIGAVGDLDRPISPAQKGYTSLTRYLTNDKLENRARRREEMLSTSADSFKEFGKKVRASQPQLRNAVFGSTTSFAEANEALAEGDRIPVVKLG